MHYSEQAAKDRFCVRCQVDRLPAHRVAGHQKLGNTWEGVFTAKQQLVTEQELFQQREP